MRDLNKKKWVPSIVLHGGAGKLTKNGLSEHEQVYRETIESVLNTGQKLFEQSSSLEIALHLVQLLENSGLFTSGKGSMPNSNGFVEMDAAVMLGKDLSAGSVTGIKNVKNPILAAEYVRTQTAHVMISGEGTEIIKKEANLETVDTQYFENKPKAFQPDLWGTVGVIVMNEKGECAAATSTGGTLGKMQGRVGDTPIIGSGIYAQDKVGAVLCTGFGEYFMRTNAAFHAISLLRYKKFNIKKALHRVIWEEIHPLGGIGGMIGIDSKGNIGLQCNSEGMFCGFVKGNKKPVSKIFRNGLILK